jgi:hypothetical protein
VLTFALSPFFSLSFFTNLKKKAAALSITNLYRSSRSTSKRAYNSGYAAACADLLQMIQQSVSDSDPETPPSIGRVMDWVEARLEAIRAREEEEEEEDEESAASRKEKEGGTGRLKASSSLPRANSAPAVPQQPPREQVSSPFLFFFVLPLSLSDGKLMVFPVAGTHRPIEIIASDHNHHGTDSTFAINATLATGYHNCTTALNANAAADDDDNNNNNSSDLPNSQAPCLRNGPTSQREPPPRRDHAEHDQHDTPSSPPPPVPDVPRIAISFHFHRLPAPADLGRTDGCARHPAPASADRVGWRQTSPRGHDGPG